MEIEIGAKLMIVLLTISALIAINIPHLINRAGDVLEKMAEIWKK